MNHQGNNDDKSTYCTSAGRKRPFIPSNNVVRDSFYDSDDDKLLEDACEEIDQTQKLIDSMADDSSIHPYTPVVKRHTQSERERERLNQTLSGHPILGPSNPPATTPTTQGRYTQLTQNTPSSSNTTAGFGSASAFFRLATELKSAKDELECEKNEVQRLGKELKRKNELIALAKNGDMATFLQKIELEPVDDYD